MNKQKISYALAFAALLGSAALSPVFADDVQVTGNGAFTDNQVQANAQTTTQTTQSNTTQATNTVTTDNSTGNNSANFNTGGTVVVQTGNANANVGVSNTAGSNTAQVANTVPTNANTAVVSNGAFSDNSTQANTSNTTSLQQTNTTDFANKVNVNNNTGNNEANFNTGSNVSVGTGNANAWVGISNTAGSNQAAVSGATGATGGSTVVAGNGAFSDSAANTDSNSSTSLTQTNNATITNTVLAKNNTGGNNENFNTGSNVGIFTGDANASIGISNTAGKNTAFVDGGSGGSQSPNIFVVSNGAFSASHVTAWNNLRTALTQSNLTYAANYVETVNNTGNNAASFNTGGETILTTGDANAAVTSFTTAGSNNAFVIDGPIFANAAEVAILDNGAFSLNRVHSTQNTDESLNQQNDTMFVNDVRTKNNVGNNNADFGTSLLAPYMMYGSNGANITRTGNANAQVGLYDLASANFLSN